MQKSISVRNKKSCLYRSLSDISNEQVFEIGSHDIEVVHFRGATSLAYQKLYEPIFSYKDELKALNKKREKELSFEKNKGITKVRRVL